MKIKVVETVTEIEATADRASYLLIIEILRLAKELVDAGYGDIQIAKVKGWQ